MPKNFFLYLFILLLGFSACTKENKIILADNRQTKYQIVVSAHARAIDLRAADTLKKYLNLVSGADFQIVNDDNPALDFEIIIGNTNRNLSKKYLKKAQALPEDAFLIKTDAQKLLFLGGADKGIIYGVYDFLEKYAGCRKYSADYTFVPKKEKIVLPEINIVEKPAFAYRELYFPGPRKNEDYREWHRLVVKEDKHTWGMFVHTFDDLVPPGKYFKDHPEYFSYLNVQRIPDGQLCLSNPDVYRVLVDNLKIKMAENPMAKYWSVSQNDTYKACTCDSCKALDKKYGGPSGTMLWFVNKVAKQFPDKIISTLAYQYTRSAPQNIKPENNVNIMFCSIECNRSRPIATDPLSKSFRKDADAWTKLTANIFMWDYVVQFRNMLSPFPNLRVLQPNIQYFRDKGMKMMFQQGTGNHKSEFYELRQYLIAKLLWNPDVNIDSIMNDFLTGYYGKAAPIIREYIDTMHNALEKTNGNLGIYGFPYDGINTYLTPDLIKIYQKQFERALDTVKNEPEYLKRVKFASLPLEFAVLDISLRNVNEDLSYFKFEKGIWKVKEGMIDKLHRFTDEALAYGVDRYWEHGNEPLQYRDAVERFVRASAKPHLARGKKVELLTKYSDKYPVGGVSALTDGLRGLSDYHFNWLGFEGEDLVAVIDLGKETMCTSVTANFLRDQYSWIFLPVEFSVAISQDGKNFITVGKLKHQTVNNREIIIKPYQIRFYPKKVRYLKITAKNMKTCPPWHPGANLPSWIFCDELVVE